MKILITGSKGQLGTELAAALAGMQCEIGPIPEAYCGAEVVGIDIDTVDISDSAALSAFAAGHADAPFGLVINCAAMTNVDACEADYDAAFLGNAVGPGNIAAFAEAQGARLVHISTDYVFDGKAKTPYTEQDEPAPATAYGKTKLVGEQRVLEACSRAFIIRTAWLYGKAGSNFVRTIQKLASENERITIVYDQVGNPTNANDLAYHILKIGAIGERGPGGESPYGVYHATGNGICSWHEFAAEIVRLMGLRCEVVPVTAEEFKRPAPRPAFSALDNMRLRATVGDSMRHWKEALSAFIEGQAATEGR